MLLGKTLYSHSASLPGWKDFPCQFNTCNGFEENPHFFFTFSRLNLRFPLILSTKSVKLIYRFSYFFKDSRLCTKVSTQYRDFICATEIKSKICLHKAEAFKSVFQASAAVKADSVLDSTFSRAVSTKFISW